MKSSYEINLMHLRFNLLERKINKLSQFYREGTLELTDIKDAGFAKHNPKISAYCLKKPENLIQALIFCVASQGVGWAVVASVFRRMYTKLLRDGHLYIKGREDEKAYDSEDWGTLMGSFGKNKVQAISALWQNKKEIFTTTKSILKNWHYDDESQESREAVMRLFDYYTSLPGLGLAKAGFAVQLVAGALGCFDSVNAKLYSAEEIPSHIKTGLIAPTGKLNTPLGHKDYSKRVQRLELYREFLDGLATEIQKPTSERLWDIWVTIVADRLRGTYLPGKQADKQTVVKRGDEEIASFDPYNAYSKDQAGGSTYDWQSKHKDISPQEVSAQHHPEYLIGGRD